MAAKQRSRPQTLATKLNNPSAGAAHGRETKKQTPNPCNKIK